ncbi:CmcJ/NvfI family oxidoreductase [Paraglaciecola aquimarina]|uniref:CmcJ/NvfI family oxidoreductase n=1 Tax=Paraglaciecola aquimarina TaxID=1235557 RepID=A0ABU3SU43_9ALTE|nr:CmcJ/NvfI family oxidoreductase [Paraglaciecola aquimarina]MDU0353530.1 CmcJ/NvfI family oxidoreductase [Paraglaciecola aquimarina]
MDAGGISGKIINPEQVIKHIAVNDVRDISRPLNFEQDSVIFTELASVTVDVDDQQSTAAYNAQLSELLKDKIGATEVIVFDHTVRTDDANAERKPARNVHSDYSPSGAKQRLIDIIGQERANKWQQGHFGFVNVWRPLHQTVLTAPLGFVQPSSVATEDWLTLRLDYPDRTGQIMGLVFNQNHHWLYKSAMTPTDAAIFNIYDNSGIQSIAHSALDLVNNPYPNRIRTSLESRTLVRY